MFAAYGINGIVQFYILYYDNETKTSTYAFEANNSLLFKIFM